ncbi:diiron oxygenase [Amycolatopsis solani]|uniref:diiron oxygenase n=1 Tax=Amycolatopsis solani TaxID=3028615 RepID=UPI0025B05A9F|nr:diiron oxygenase [Amycolatopsis sp. MEP2-6]
MTTQTDPPSLREAIASMAGKLDRLTELSRAKYTNPYRTVEWPAELDPETGWFFTPELSSLYGTSAWPSDETAARRLAFHEAANFFSLNIHGEKALMEGVARRLYRPDLAEIADYLHHFLDEENKHSVYFGGFCRRYDKVYRSRHLPFVESADREVSDLLFFAKVLIFEEHADRYNVLQARDDRLHPLALFINEAHHADESRHLVFNRAIVEALWQVYSPSWSTARLAELRAYLGQFFVTTWREYYNPDVYADCGHPDPWEVAEAAWHATAQRQHRRRVSAKCLKFLLSTGLLAEEPADAF